MPTYQYVCTECGHDFETVQSFSEDALSVCPVCGGRLIEIRGKLQCSACHTICETCCEGGRG